MKKVNLFLLVWFSLFAFVACSPSTGPNTTGNSTGNGTDPGNSTFNDPEDNYTGKLADVTGQYTTPEQSSTDGGTVTVYHLPKSVKLFTKLRQEIAQTPHGAAACFVIALNMFMENPPVGEACLVQCVTKSQRDRINPNKLASVRQIIYDRYAPSSKGSSVYSPWIPYCEFEGFKAVSGWKKPNPPFKMIFGRNSSKSNENMENSQYFHGYSIPMTIDAFDNTTSPKSRFRNITAVKIKGEDLYVLLDFDNLINTASYKRP